MKFSRRSFLESVYSLDAFAEPFNFVIPGGKAAFRSGKGCTMTVLLLMVLVFYGIVQSINLATFDETDIMVS